MNPSRSILSIGIIVLLAAGCSAKVPQSPTSSDHAMQGHGAMMRGSDHGAQLAGSRLELQNKDGLSTGAVVLAFKLRGLDGNELKPQDLNVAHEKLIHLILVRDDDTQFQHIHPEYVNGQWTVTTTIPEQGLYQMYADIEPKQEAPVVLRTPLTIVGPTEHPQFPAVSSGGAVSVDGITVTLQNAATFKSNEALTLHFMLTQNGKPVTAIGPYLGAFGHAVVLEQGNPNSYLHAHPITETAPVGGVVEFQSKFPTAGTYTVFAQFNINNQIKTFPITIVVKN